MPPYKLFSTARSYPFGSDQFSYTTGYILPLQFHTCISNFMFHKSTPTRIFLRFTFIQIQVVFLSFFLSSIKYNIIFTGIHCEQHEAITLSYFTQHLLSNIYGLLWHKIITRERQYGSHYLYLNLKNFKNSRIC